MFSICNLINATHNNGFLARAATQQKRADELLQRAKDATETTDIERFTKLSDNIARAAEISLERATAAQAEASTILLGGLIILLIVKTIQGLYADYAHEKQYTRWRINPDQVESGMRLSNKILGILLVIAIAPLVIFKFTSTRSVPQFLSEFPEKTISSLFLGTDNGTLFAAIAGFVERRIDAAAIAGGGVFDGIVRTVRAVLDALTLGLNGSPWPVVMIVIVVTAWRSAGPRVATFTSAALCYIAFLGY